MSDHSISIVPRISNYPDKEKKSQEILAWLIAQDIVQEKKTPCILDFDKGGYAISQGAKQITKMADDLPFTHAVNGLEITTQRNVFDGGENLLAKIICPHCSNNIALDDWDLNPWFYKKSEELVCPRCQVSADVQKYIFEPAWGFSDLAFTFWNWADFTDEFLQLFKEKLNCEIAVVYRQL